MKTRLILIRHGESLGNSKRIILGHTDWDLSPLGYRQAEITAAALADRRVDAIYSSDLIRAYHTVLPMASSRGLTVTTDTSLRELYVGEWEGREVHELIDTYGDLYLVDWRQHFGTFTAPGGESVVALGERIEQALARIAEKNEGKTLIIGLHAAAIRSFWGRISGISPENLAGAYPFPTNASFSEVDFEGGEFYPVAYSCDAHLAELVTAFNA